MVLECAQQAVVVCVQQVALLAQQVEHADEKITKVQYNNEKNFITHMHAVLHADRRYG